MGRARNVPFSARSETDKLRPGWYGSFEELADMGTDGGPRYASDLKRIVDRRLSEARDLRHRAASNGEHLDENYALGSIRELAVHRFELTAHRGRVRADVRFSVEAARRLGAQCRNRAHHQASQRDGCNADQRGRVGLPRPEQHARPRRQRGAIVRGEP